MNITTAHLLNNLARAENCGWQKQMHVDGTYNWCEKDFGIIGIGMNSMGSHFNPVSINLNIVNSESKQAIECSFTATISGLYNLYQQVKLCDSDECGFCRQLDVQVQGQHGKMFREVLTKSAAQNNEFPIDKPSSDRTNSFSVGARTSSVQRSPSSSVETTSDVRSLEIIFYREITLTHIF